MSNRIYLNWHRIVGDRLIISCHDRGIIKLWNLNAAIDPATRDDASSLLLQTFDTLPSPYSPLRQIKTLAMQADEFQIALVIQHDAKPPHLYLMDFLTSTVNDEELEKRTRHLRKRRQV